MDNSLFLNDQEFLQLDQIIGELPTKYGIKFVAFFQLIRQKRNAEALAVEKKLDDVSKTFKENSLDALAESISRVDKG